MYRSSFLILVSVIFVTCSVEYQRVYGGQKLNYGNHKYLVKLEVIDLFGYSYVCSGSIIATRWIVTAAHCIQKYIQSVAVLHYVKGELTVIATVEPSNTFVHIEYKNRINFEAKMDVDVALLRTNKRMVFDNDIQPIELSKYPPKLYQRAVIAGFGDSEDKGFKGTQGIVVITDCGLDEMDAVCTGDLVRGGSGDSGGALVSKGKLIGIVSASCSEAQIDEPCATIYVNVAARYKWIKYVVNYIS